MRVRVSPILQTAFLILELPSEEVARRVAARSMLIFAIYELWGYGNNFTELGRSIGEFPAERKDPYTVRDSTFKVLVEAMGHKLSMEEQKEKRDALFDMVDFQGTVRLKDPQHTFMCIEHFGLTEEARAGPARAVYFGRELGVSDRGPMIKRFDLKKRGFLCPTSMPAELSFLVANLAHARPGALLLDPFCGSGSLLIAAAARGASVMGAELDWRILHGRKHNSKVGHSGDRTIWSNFAEYNLAPPLDMVRLDAGHAAWRFAPIFDAIVCDPPYGIRAGARTAGTMKEARPIPEEYRDPALHFPGTIAYPVSDVLKDLLDVASRVLVVGGRLVFWLPSTEGYTDADLPRHPALHVIPGPRVSRMSWCGVAGSAQQRRVADPAMAATAGDDGEAGGVGRGHDGDMHYGGPWS